MKRWLVRIAVGLLTLILLAIFAGYLASEPRPDAAPSPEADALARRIEEAVDAAAWRDTGAIWWSFPGGYAHLWDKKRGLARVRWRDTEVLLDLATRTGIATKNGRAAGEKEAADLVDHAYRRWVNDSFWLNPLVKLFDEGTTRALVHVDGADALLITYTSGGVTPGDAYLWKIGDDGLPTAWKMWVGIIPIGGLEVSWERWITLPTGAKISTLHRSLFTLEITDVIAAPDVLAIEPDDPFAQLKSHSNRNDAASTGTVSPSAEPTR